MLVRNAPGTAPAAPELRRRMRWVIVVVTVVLSGLVGRLWQLQVVRGEQYYERARKNVVSERFLPSVRGKIVDRSGTALADNRPAFNIYVDLARFDDSERERLIDVLDLSEEDIERLDERLEVGKKRKSTHPVLVLQDQGRDRAALVAQSRQDIPSVEVRDEPYRNYPHERTAAHLIGYMNHLTGKELEQLEPKGYGPSEFIGRYGLERKYEHYLRGKKGRERYVVNARGDRIEDAETEDLIEGVRFVPPVAGHNVVLTLDLELQQLVERAVAKHAAAGVAVVDVNTGDILALVSTPVFDPNVMTGKLTRAESARMNADPRKPFIDKTLRQHYPPGSTFKFVTAAVAIDDGVVDDEDTLVCPGSHQQGKRTFRCTSGHGRIGMLAAIQHSCNVFFWKLSERIGLDRIAEIAVDFGLGAPTGLGLNGDVPGRIPTRAWYDERDVFKIGYTLNAATGQGDVEVTVLQMAMAYAAVANGGKLYVPQIVDRIETASGEQVVAHQPSLRRTVKVSESSLGTLRRGMWMVVNTPGGTAYTHARSDLLEYAGKTGTAQVRNRRQKDSELAGWHPHRDHAWFAGFAPAVNPEIAVVVLIEHGGSGGKVAGPVAREIIEGHFSKEAKR